MGCLGECSGIWSTVAKTSGTTAEYTEGEPGTTYYFLVEYILEGESTYAEVDAEEYEIVSAEFPEFSPGIAAIDYIGFTDELPLDGNFTGN
jgi:hypothetical protein